MEMYLGSPENLARQELLLSPRTTRFSIGQKHLLPTFGIVTPSLGVSSAHAASVETI